MNSHETAVNLAVSRPTLGPSPPQVPVCSDSGAKQSLVGHTGAGVALADPTTLPNPLLLSPRSCQQAAGAQALRQDAGVTQALFPPLPWAGLGVRPGPSTEVWSLVPNAHDSHLPRAGCDMGQVVHLSEPCPHL